MGYSDFTSPTEAVNQWIDVIAPMYFDFDTKKLHRSGVFGYINEVMSTTNMDTYHGVTVARREFYPNTANYTKSLFKMAALQQIGYPLANAGVASAVILLSQEQILSYGQLEPGAEEIYKLVIDNDMLISAGEIPFMLDYPIKILFKRAQVVSHNQNDTMGNFANKSGAVTFTNTDILYNVSYDTTYKNSQNTQTEKYIKHRLVTYGGQKLLLMQVGIRQCTRTVMEQVINRSPSITNVTLDFPYSGDMCNFEVFYTPHGSDELVQLEKLPLNANPINKEFVMYSLTSDGVLRLTFPENNYFVPKFNSIITVHIYTTLGASGNFRIYNGDLLCSPQSDKYDYNRVLQILGQVQGSCIGGYDMPSFEVFRQKVVRAYATNRVICTDQDLQMYFDNQMDTTNNKILFYKRRDDVFERLYGAFMLMHDYSGNLVPTNSLVAYLRIMEDFNSEEKTGYLYGDRTLPTSLCIKPGGIWKYNIAGHRFYNEAGYGVERAYHMMQITSDNYKGFGDMTYVDDLGDGSTKPVQWVFENGVMRTLTNDTESDNYTGKFIGQRCYPLHDKKRYTIQSDIEDTEEEMLYTNPFLIEISRLRNSVAYYLNSCNDTVYMNMTDVNDKSFVQFSNTSLSVQRNALMGENFYKLTIKLQPTIESDNLREILLNDRTDISNINNSGGQYDWKGDRRSPSLEIRAQYGGKVIGYRHMIARWWTCGCGATCGKDYDKFAHINCQVCGGPTVDRSVSTIFQVIKYDIPSNEVVTLKDIVRYADIYERDKDSNEFLLPTVDDFGNFLNYIPVSPNVGYTFPNHPDSHYEGEKQFYVDSWYDPIYGIGDTFTKDSIIAIRKVEDTTVLRVIGQFDGIDKVYLPFYIEDYNKDSDVYTLCAYLATNDNITDEGLLTITGGLYHDDVKASLEKAELYVHVPYTDPLTINPYNLTLSISSYLRYDDVYSNNTLGYVNKFTKTNTYDNRDSKGISLLNKFDFIRTTITDLTSDTSTYIDEDGNTQTVVLCPDRLILREMPLVRATWARKAENFTQLIETLNNNNAWLNETYDLLENNYTIDLKFYNTYGKSRFYRIGIGDPAIEYDLQEDTLDRVCIKLKFGVKISALSDTTQFEERFITFLRSYVEGLNNIGRQGDAINLMEMVTAINNNFDEIERLEYYGIDDRDASKAQYIRSWSKDEIDALGYKEYIPEWINVYLAFNYITDDYEPDIEITALD